MWRLVYSIVSVRASFLKSPCLAIFVVCDLSSPHTQAPTPVPLGQQTEQLVWRKDEWEEELRPGQEAERDQCIFSQILPFSDAEAMQM